MTKKYNKRTAFGTLVALFALFLVVGACSTEKNTFINRTYHSTTAKYNGYFNAKELIRIGLEEYRYGAREDFNEILPVELYPNEEDVVDNSTGKNSLKSSRAPYRYSSSPKIGRAHV